MRNNDKEIRTKIAEALKELKKALKDPEFARSFVEGANNLAAMLQIASKNSEEEQG